MTLAARLRAARRAPAQPAIAGRLVRLGERTFGGHAIDPRDPTRRLAVELLVDGFPAAVLRADSYDPGLAREGHGDGRHAFRVTLGAIEPGSVVSARIANLDLPVGEPILLAGAPAEPMAASRSGLVRWLGGLRFTGWVPPRNGEAWVGISVDGETIAEIRADGWTRPVPPSDPAEAVPAFDAHLPDRLADGRPHRLVARNAAGEELAGSPLAFRAESALSVPMAEYPLWRARHPPPGLPALAEEVAVILVGDGAADDTLPSLEAQTHSAWICAAPPAAEAGPAFDRDGTLAFLDGEARDAAIIVFALAGSVLREDALQRLAGALLAAPASVAAYSDLEVIAADGEVWPLIFPAFDRERFREQGYCAHFFAARAEAVREAVAGGADNLYALFDAVTAGEDAAVIAVPGPLATLPRFDREAASLFLTSLARTAEPGIEIHPLSSPFFPAVHLRRRSKEDVTVALLAPVVSERTAASLAALGPAVEATGADVLVVAADDGVAAPEGATLVTAGGHGARARLINAAIAAARSDLICLVDDGMIAEGGDWLAELHGRAGGSRVAAVSPAIIDRDGLLRHAGAVLGPDFAVAPAFADATLRDPGHAGMLMVAREVAALMPGCILYRRDACLAAGGADEIRFPHRLADADLCLRLRGAGARLIVTPHARLVDTRHAAARQGDGGWESELRAFRARWADALAADPTYSPLLSLDAMPWTALADPPRDMAPRDGATPRMVDVPPGF